MSLLILGGTGTLGRQIVKQALQNGYQVKCMTRSFRRANFLKEWGAELVYGDLSLPETLPPALKGISFVIDASTVRPTDVYNLEKIDWKGKLALIEAAKIAKIKKFICFSILGATLNKSIPFVDVKLKIEKVLNNVPFSCTIFECAGFFQGLINQYAIPILEQKPIWLLGASSPIAYLDTQDAAFFIVQSLTDLEPQTKKVSLIGSKFWTSEEIVALCERLSGKTAKVIYMPPFLLTILSRFLRLFEFTWNISDRLQFSEFTTGEISKLIINLPDKNFESRLKLENYLQEYFAKILKKLKETNYQQSNNQDISFL